MNTNWSDYVQGVGTLYLSRMLRFSNQHRQAYMQAFDLDGARRLRMLELGCGPGALTQSLARWYPNADITAIDLDSAFIEFAAHRAPGLRFIEADATALPFEDGEFDVTISNTVQEHIAPERFFGEQHRVLKRGGVCLVLSARRGVNIEADCVAQQSDFERDIWARVSERCRNMDRDLGVGRHAMSERELPQAMEAHGFDNVSTHYIAVNLTPDDPDVSPEAANAMIDAQRRMRLDAVQSLEQIAPDVVGKAELSELEAHVNRRYDERLALYDAGKRQWDVSVSLTMVVRGVKR
ncbi:MAG TPA: methyltransferase domain-containing protein [Candidatus Fimadaptatus faecigallinarum]|uniref:Methyltransferase domain-containing protein n=1 Tax=Candidatus Fimadaptatus faecigallinarum TaxID=2840814 RepID=A0A9D1LS70_9FIRM|nr:methyltransferase domain-containing protein [Candidatus Fimadaptatus faecigallinarum]